MNQISVLAFVSALLVVGCTLNITNVLPDASGSDGGGGTTSTSTSTDNTTSTTTSTASTSTTSTATTDTSSGSGGAGGSEPACTREVTYTIKQAYPGSVMKPYQNFVELSMVVDVSECGDVRLERMALMLEDMTNDVTSYCDSYCQGSSGWSWNSSVSFTNIGEPLPDLVGVPDLVVTSDGISMHTDLQFVYEVAAQDLWFKAGTTTLVYLALELTSMTPIGRQFRTWVSEFNPMYEEGVVYHGYVDDATFVVVAP